MQDPFPDAQPLVDSVPTPCVSLPGATVDPLANAAAAAGGHEARIEEEAAKKQAEEAEKVEAEAAKVAKKVAAEKKKAQKQKEKDAKKDEAKLGRRLLRLKSRT